MKNFNLSKAIFPNTFTSLNALCGFLAIIFISQNKTELGIYLIFGAAICDAIDGIIARMIGTSSKFGVELDSLSDIISFGAAPSFLVYQAFLSGYGIIGMVISSSLLIFGSYRLARFNIQLDDYENKKEFSGLPIPTAALTMVAFTYNFQDSFYNGSLQFYLFFILVAMLSLLMVSKIKYDALPNIFQLTNKFKVLLLLTLVAAIALTYITKGIIIFYILVSIILFGIFKNIFYYLFKNKNPEDVKLKQELN
ncbi:MAG: CDP-diacylglycerol--serine O-phosphatidyltransferase [Ignavibacteria bacterium]|jgi:CDP-diacylglycerol--serine O-phosphatidyltransferase